jgi:hypothetical protein
MAAQVHEERVINVIRACQMNAGWEQQCHIDVSQGWLDSVYLGRCYKDELIIMLIKLLFYLIYFISITVVLV